MNFLKALATLEIIGLGLLASACSDGSATVGLYPTTCSPPDSVRRWSGGASDFITKNWYCFGAREEWIAITFSKRPWCEDWRLEAVDVREGRCK